VIAFNILPSIEAVELLEEFVRESLRPRKKLSRYISLEDLIEFIPSLSSVVRLTDVHQKTILKLLVLAGEKCERVMARKIVNVKVRDVECDELWSFIGKKEKRVRPEDDQNLGDCYVFVAVERHSKLVLNIAMGKRDQATTDVFVEGIRHATAASHFQITTDGFVPYKSAITTTLRFRPAHQGLSRAARRREALQPR